jgi:hypothetical protein
MMILTTISCIEKKSHPCAAIYRIEGVNLVVRDKNTSANLISLFDSFEVKGFSGYQTTLLRNAGDTSFYAAFEDLPLTDLYFRIKPSTNIDTISATCHAQPYNDGSCEGTYLVIDSVFHNGIKLNASHTFFYQQ